MKRRKLISLVGAAASWPYAARSQPNVEAPKLGFVYPGPKEVVGTRVDAVVGGMRDSGYPVPQLELVVRAAEGDASRLAPMVAEVMQKRVTAILAVGRPVVEAARAATKDIPIVAIDLESDPISSGFADSLARPGHNLTGVFLDFPDFAAKLLQLLVESAPGMQRLAVLWDPTTGPLQNESVKRTAAALKLQTAVFEVRVRGDFEQASYRPAGFDPKQSSCCRRHSSRRTPRHSPILPSSIVCRRSRRFPILPAQVACSPMVRTCSECSASPGR
jgi:putative ABC transport system substrate-binding protein